MIYGQPQNAKRKRRPVNAKLHALQMIASRPRQTVKRNARFALQQPLQLLLHLAVEIQTGPKMNTVMTKTTIQAAIMMAELVVIMTSVPGTTFAQ